MLFRFWYNLFNRLLIFSVIIYGMIIPISYLNAQTKLKIDSLISVLDLTINNNDRAKILNDLSKLSSRINPNDGLKYAQEALDATLSSDLKSERARAYNYMGGNLIYLAEYDQSIENFNKAKEIFKEINDVKGLANIEGNIGIVYMQMGLFSKALNAQFQALKSFEELTDSSGICNTFHTIGTIYMEIGNREESLKYNIKSLDCCNKMNDLKGVGTSEGAIANILVDMGRISEARAHYERSIEIFKNENMLFDLARELTNFATYYEHLGQLAKAIELTSRSLDNFEEIDSKYGISMAKGNLGAYYLTAYENVVDSNKSMEQLQISLDDLLLLSEENIEGALELAEGNNTPNIVAWLSGKLAKVYENLNQPTKALQLYKQADRVQDSIYSAESKKEVEVLVTEREVMLKDKQIELDKLAVEKKRNERVYFVIGIILLVLFIIVVYNNYKNQLNSNVKLKSLNVQVNDANSALETKNYTLKNALNELQLTQRQLVITERQKEKAELRSKISQDIHDDISSGLTKISWFSELFKSKLAKGVDKEKLETIVDKINLSSRETVNKLGEIIWSTSPKRDNVESFLSYIKTHVNSFLGDSEIDYIIDFPLEVEDINMNPEVRRNLYLITKEALNNAFKYSRAEQITISFKLKNNQYEMSISDNGIGIEENIVRKGGHGLLNMTDRMKAINGELTINSDLGTGTTLILKGPLDFT